MNLYQNELQAIQGYSEFGHLESLRCALCNISRYTTGAQEIFDDPLTILLDRRGQPLIAAIIAAVIADGNNIIDRLQGWRSAVSELVGANLRVTYTTKDNIDRVSPKAGTMHSCVGVCVDGRAYLQALAE